MNHYAEFAAKKERVMDRLTSAGATSRENALPERDFTEQYGDLAAREAYAVAVCGGEVKYSRTAGYWIGRTRNNGRS